MGTTCSLSPGHHSCFRLQVSPQCHHTHRSDVAAVGGTREDLELELQLPVKRDPVSAWTQGQPSPLSLTPHGQRDCARTFLSPAGHSIPSLLRGNREIFWQITELPIPAPDMTSETARDHLASTIGCLCQGPAPPGDTTYMSLQTPLKAFHHGSDSSVEVMCWSMHF